jgi:monofunctional biosynthetic peptidoglycan transglycosylase
MARKTRKKPAAKPKAQANEAAAATVKPRLWLRVIGWVAAGLLAAVLLSVLYVRFLPPPMGVYMLSERMRLGSLQRQWVPLSGMSVNLPLSVVAAEDANFCLHYGFDFEAIRDAFSDDSRRRGGSTISQQVAKNVYLWHGRTWLRKGLEAGFSGLIELTWPKRRIVEVYLNVAEFDEGVFGAAAAAQHYFGVTPDKVSATQAARLAAVLPSPKKSSAGKPSAYIRKRAAQIRSGAGTIAADGRADCFTSG